MNKKLKFVATANGEQIRLFPWNYGVLRHEPGRSPYWLINIDTGCPKHLALLIFGEYHTNFNLRWGEDRNETVRILNELL